ncbi:MAG TPA: hypothetical protein VND68_06770 [Chloroflexia bacterium]|nr:hypothetical protein [Chloroflexia bacterium]
MDRSTHKSVWYRWSSKRIWTPFAPQDVGTLLITRRYLEYSSRRRNVRIPIADISSISMGRQGSDWINKWVKVEYGREKVAYFADGRFLGWRGILGGTRRLLDRLKLARSN